jgi:hypothetical protein
MSGTNRIPDIKTSIEMESIFVPNRSQARLTHEHLHLLSSPYILVQGFSPTSPFPWTSGSAFRKGFSTPPPCIRKVRTEA